MDDVIVVGGGVAGLNAALILGRARRSVLVLDSGSPRNAPAAHAQGFLTRDGTPPLEILRLARDELKRYASVEILEARAAAVGAIEDGYRVDLESGQQFTARKLVLATGVTDVLPEIPGINELWSKGIHHCPFCHGWEVRDRTWAILGDSGAFDRVAMFRGWAKDLIVLAHGPTSLTEDDLQKLTLLGAVVDERRISGFLPHGEDGVRITFEDGSSQEVGAVFVMPGQSHNPPFAADLGCELYEVGPPGLSFVKTDSVSGETTVPGVYAAGDLIGPMQSLILSAASGARAGYMITHVLAMEDAHAITGTSPVH